MNDYLKKLFLNLNINLSDKQIEQFNLYEKLLVSWNEKINLTAIVEPEKIRLLHFADSASAFLSGVISGKIADVGTGAGFPGIVLKIVNPDINLTLIDSLNKRINFLGEVVDALELKGVNLIHTRAEDAGHDKNLREKFDVAIARAVAPLNVLSEYCLPLVKKDGYFIAMKAKLNDEVKEAKNAFCTLGADVFDIKNVEKLGDDIERNLVILKKYRQTSLIYPRKAGKPSKNPL